MDDMSAAEMKRLNLGLPVTTKPYLPGQKNIPNSTFNQKLIPMCLECGKVTVDYWTYGGSTDLDFWCSDRCDDKWSRRRELERQEQSRAQSEYLKSMKGAL